ncbi:MAG: hypothetical protein ACE5M4_10505 [Anaerolineales bacterium]
MNHVSDMVKVAFEARKEEEPQMVNIETSVLINKPVEEVFEFVDDTNNDVK